MASSQIVDNFLNTIIDTPQIAFTAPSGQSVTIDSFTVSNNSTVNANYKAYIKTSLGPLSPIVPFQIVVWGEIDLGIGIVNQTIPPGGTLQIESSALSSLYLTVSGRETT